MTARHRAASGPWLIVSLFCLAAFACAGFVGAGEYLPAAVLILACAAPCLLFALSQVLAWKEPYASFTCIVLIIVLSSVFRARDIDDKSIDAQVLSKLICLCLMGLMALTAHLRTDSLFNSSNRLVYALVLMAFMAVECANAVMPSVAFVEAISNVIAVLFLAGISERLGSTKLVNILLAACSCMCVMSIFCYYAYPQLGRMTDWVNDAYTTSSRLQGVFGTPNAAGASAAFCLLIVVLRRRDAWRLPDFAQVGLFATILLATNNRMAMVAVVGATTLFYLCRHGSRLVIAGGVGLIACSVLVYAAYGERLLVLLSRSGSIDEIASGTGRTAIWSVVVDLWFERPLLGYGVGSAKFILPHHPLLFAAAAHAHDLYLNVLFAGGAVGLGFLVASLGAAIGRAWSLRSDCLLTLICFFLFYGVTEPIIGGLASFVSMAFYSALLLTHYGEALAPRARHSTDWTCLGPPAWARSAPDPYRDANPC